MSVFDAYISLATGLFMGAVIGFVAQQTNFCSTGAIADIILANDWRRARSWIMAAVAALAGTHAAAAFDLVPLAHNSYTTPIGNPILTVPGGITFGYGMAIAGGCLQRALVRVGGGSVRSLITVAVMVAFGFLTLWVTNKTNLWKMTWPNIEVPSSMPQVANAAFDTHGKSAALVVGGVVATTLLAFCLKDKWFRSSREHLRGGVVIGLVVAFAWLILPSTYVYARGLNPLWT